jgi:predicted O-methyltransferase YrrM
VIENPRWTAVDELLTDRLVPPDAASSAALTESAAAGLPDISVTATQGKLLMLLGQLVRAERVLEVGTLGGYSTIWLARGLAPGGRVTSLEIDAGYAQVARRNLDRAGLADRVEVRVGPALESLAELVAESAGSYDLVFVDADKRSTPAYVERALQLTRPGSVIVVDNVVRGGQVLDAKSEDPDVRGIRDLLTLVGQDPRLDATALQTVGAKGYDGFLLALVTG